MDPFFAGMGIFSFVFIIFAIIISILWTMLPFAIFGIKNRLDKLIDLLEKVNFQLSSIEKELINVHKNCCEYKKDKEEAKANRESNDDYTKYMPKQK